MKTTQPSWRAMPLPPKASASTRRSSSSPFCGRVVVGGPVVLTGPVWQASAQAPLDGPQDRLAVAVAALDVAPAPPLGRGEVRQATGPLARVELLVAGDREGGAEPGRLPGPADPAARELGHGPPASEELVEGGQDVLGLPAAARDEVVRHRLRVVARQAPTAHRVIERLLQRVRGHEQP